MNKPGTPSDDARAADKEHGDREGNPGHGAAMKPANESDFVMTVAKKGMAELKAAQLGVEKAEDEKVKELAQMIVTDHTSANANLKTVAEGLSIKLPGAPDEKGEQKCKELSGLSGKAFDQAFLAHMDMCHEKSIAYFEAGRKVAKSEEVTAFIDKTLPVLKAHAKKIDELHTGARADAGTPEKPAVTSQGSQPQPGTNRR